MSVSKMMNAMKNSWKTGVQAENDVRYLSERILLYPVRDEASGEERNWPMLHYWSTNAFLEDLPDGLPTRGDIIDRINELSRTMEFGDHIHIRKSPAIIVPVGFGLTDCIPIHPLDDDEKSTYFSMPWELSNALPHQIKGDLRLGDKSVSAAEAKMYVINIVREGQEFSSVSSGDSKSWDAQYFCPNQPYSACSSSRRPSPSLLARTGVTSDLSKSGSEDSGAYAAAPKDKNTSSTSNKPSATETASHNNVIDFAGAIPSAVGWTETVNEKPSAKGGASYYSSIDSTSTKPVTDDASECKLDGTTAGWAEMANEKPSAMLTRRRPNSR